MVKVGERPVDLSKPMKQLANDIYYLDRTQADLAAAQDEFSDVVGNVGDTIEKTNDLLGDLHRELVSLREAIGNLVDAILQRSET